MAETPIVLTIGHSTHPLDKFIHLLQVHTVARVIDVRTIPRSRRNPQFNRGVLSHSLNAAGIAYTHLRGLGGLRPPHADSLNTGWRDASFQGFADYMQTPDFAENLQTLLELAQAERLALMCAEAVPWRCHRFLIADTLVIRSIQVEHIMSLKRVYTHSLTSWAKVSGTHITYPAETASSSQTSSE